MNEKFMAPIKSESLVQEVINRITEAIISGDLGPGDRLPTEVELMSSLGVSRNTVREAVRTLIAYGVVEIRRPEGTFVCKGTSPKMLNPVLYQTILAGTDSQQYLQNFRKVIETGICQLIRENGLTDADRDELHRLNDSYARELSREVCDVALIHRLDSQFHKAMAAATHNPFVVMLHDFLADITAESRRRVVEKVCAEHNQEYLIKVHSMTLDCLENKNGVDISEVISFSYIYWKDAYKW